MPTASTRPAPRSHLRAVRALPAALLAALLATTAPATWAANSGGDVVTIHSEDWYIGTPGSSYNNVFLDMNPDPSYPLSPYRAAAGGYSSTDDTVENRITVTGITVEGINGGFNDNGNATYNKVFINNGSTMGWIHGGTTNDGNATGNEVHINGGTVTGDIWGGWADNGNATKNMVFINGGEVMNVYGSSTYGSAATGNTVTLAGGKVTGKVWGGECSSTGTCDDTTNNTLAVHAQGLEVGGSVDNFEKLEFKLPASIKAGGAPMLKVGGDITLRGSSAKISITVDGTAALKPGDSITLVEAGRYLTIVPPASITAGDLEFVLSAENEKLIATVKGPAPAPTPCPACDNSSPTLGEFGLLLSGLALAGAAAPALRRRERKARKQD